MPGRRVIPTSRGVRPPQVPGFQPPRPRGAGDRRRSISTGTAIAIALTTAIALTSGSAGAVGHGRSRVKVHPDWERHPATQHGRMSAEGCLAELTRQGIAFTSVERAPGVLAPVRLVGDVDGVVYRTANPEAIRATNPFDVFDCRLVLALADFSRVLRAHDIDRVILFSAWRPPGRRWEDGAIGTRHPGGLAIDAYRFGKRLAAGEAERDRRWLDVTRDFRPHIGAPVCGADAPAPQPGTLEGRELRSIVCEAADQHMFTVMLTPHYNRAHSNHLHLEVTPAVRWYLVR